MRPRVLVCDDEHQIVRALRVVLRDAGFDVTAATTSEEALDAAAVAPPDAAIVDLMMPGIDGIGITRRLREWTALPVIILSAVGDEAQKVVALEAGADDYVTKPFHPAELVARLRAVLRRASSAKGTPVITAGGLEIDLADRTVRRDGAEVHLTRTEIDLLAALARNPGRLLTHRALLTELWGPHAGDDTQALRSHVANLRRKLEAPGAARLVRTESGVGYRFAAAT